MADHDPLKLPLPPDRELTALRGSHSEFINWCRVQVRERREDAVRLEAEACTFEEAIKVAEFKLKSWVQQVDEEFQKAEAADREARRKAIVPAHPEGLA